MTARQTWLFPPAQPLVDRLGTRFFRAIPARPGVYLMRNQASEVVYVGKAKNLRQRLGAYRVANPERAPRRHLRLMHEVARIDFDLCRNESAALAHEAKLLLELRPKFNRAGVWPGKAQFLTWRFTGRMAQFSIVEVPPLDWERFGSLGGYASKVLGAVVRLVWLALNPQSGFCRLPYGWAQNRFSFPVPIECGTRQGEIRRALENLCWGDAEEFSAWLLACTRVDLPAFDRLATIMDFEEIAHFIATYREGKANSRQLALL